MPWCGGPFNGGNCRRCTNVSFGDEFVRNPDPISNDETPDFSYPPSQPQTSSLDQFSCFHCGYPLEDGVRCQWCTCKWCGYKLKGGFCLFCASKDGNSYIDAPNPNSFNDPPNYSINHQPQSIQEDLNQQKMNDEFKIELRNELLNIMQSLCERILQREQAANESTIVSQIPPSIAITPVLPTLEPGDSLSMGDEHLSTIPEKESDEVIKSSVKDFVPIPSESEDTSESDSDYDLPSCNDFSPIHVPEEKFVTFSNPLFDLNDDFTSSDDESLSDEDVLEDNVKIYSNPLFKFDDEYISSDVNPLFYEVLENIESKDSYVSNLDEPDLLVTPLFDANEDECFDPGGDIHEIDAFLDIDDCPDYEDSRAHGFVHRSLDLQSLAFLYMGIRYPISDIRYPIS
ncbi:hypothetical protein Tco_0492997 [Tanacetum coccineum]